MIPDRISSERSSPFFNETAYRVECRLDGVVQSTAIEACVSEGWIRRLRVDNEGRIVGRSGQHVIETVKGNVELTLLAARKK